MPLVSPDEGIIKLGRQGNGCGMEIGTVGYKLGTF